MTKDSKIIRVVLSVLVGGLLLMAPLYSNAANELTLFELEGNAVDDAGTPGDDWDTVLLGSGGSSISTTGVVVDQTDTSIFTQGGSKDTQDIPKWRWKDGSVPDKDDITNAYAAAYLEPSNNDLLIYVGADRYSNTGDAVMGLWLFQNEISLNPDGTFNGEHAIGDILAVAEFSNGGQTVNIVLYEWAGMQGNKSQLNEIDIGSSAKCGVGTFNIGCAITNTSTETSPWSYTPKAGTSGMFPPVSFFEGVFNISELARQLNFEIPCFSSFMVQSRSSTSLTAQLKDFVVGSFETCKLSLTKNCPTGGVNAGETAFVYNYNGVVTNDGFGTLYDVIVIDNNGTPGNTDDDIEHTIGELAAGASQAYSGSFESSENPAINTAQAYARSSVNALERTVHSDPQSDTCPRIDKDPNISITKSCETFLDSSGGQVVVGVNFSGMVCNTGDIGLTNIRVIESIPEVTFSDPIAGSLSKAGTPNECDGYAGTYYPSSAASDPGLASFSNTITVKADAVLDFGTVEPEEPATANCKVCVQP